MNLPDLKKFADGLPAAKKMPSIFIGHGSPTNAIEDNAFTRRLQEVGRTLEKPKAALVVSAHWLTRGSFVATTEKPGTIHDFGGFQREMYEQQYPAPGSPENAKLVQETVKKIQVGADPEMGLDHGAWTILKHIWPDASVPVFQLSIDFFKSPQWHYELAQELKTLREKGILLIGSGNIVHNLRRVNFSDPEAAPEDWAAEFDEKVKAKIDANDHEALINYLDMGAAAKIAVPTNDHYLPLLYTLGAQGKDEAHSYLYEGFQFGNVSMRCVQVG